MNLAVDKNNLTFLKMKRNYILTKSLFVLLSIIVLPACNRSGVKQPAEDAAFMFEEFTIMQLQQGYAKGDFTVTDVVQAYLDRIDAIDDAGPMLNAVIQVNPDAMAIAAQLDAELSEGKEAGSYARSAGTAQG